MGILDGLHKLLADLPQMHNAMAACPEAANEWAPVKTWFEYWKQQGMMKVYQTAFKNFQTNYKAVAGAAGIMVRDFQGKDYFGAGRAAEWISIGHTPHEPLAPADAPGCLPMSPSPVDEALGDIQADCEASLNTMAVADVLAGFTFGFTGHDDKAYFETCIHDTPQFEKDMCAVSAAFATKDTQKATEAMHTVLADMPFVHSMLAGCPNALADVEYPINWYNYYHQQGMMVVYQQAYKNVSTNFTEIVTWADAMAAQFSLATGPNWFNIGNYAAMIAKTALPQHAVSEVYLQ